MLWIHKSLSFPFSFFYHIFGKVYKIHCLCKCSLPVVNNEACGKSYLCSSSSLQSLVCRLLFSSCTQVKDSLSSSYVNLRAFLLFLSRPWTNCLAVFGTKWLFMSDFCIYNTDLPNSTSHLFTCCWKVGCSPPLTPTCAHYKNSRRTVHLAISSLATVGKLWSWFLS